MINYNKIINNDQDLTDTYQEVSLWLLNDENYYHQFKQLINKKYNYMPLSNLVKSVIANNLDSYKVNKKYIHLIVKELIAEYKGEDV